MSANDLLIWMSARVEGSWHQFRSAVEALRIEGRGGDSNEAGEDITGSDLPLYQDVRLGLERLAHVEFTSVQSDRRWRVVPPTLAITRSRYQYVGILCGARAPGLRTSLLQLSGNVSVDSQSEPGMPDRFCLVSPDIELLDCTGQELGLLVQRSTPNTLLSGIPSIGDTQSWFPAEPPSTPGWTIHQFSATDLQWKGSNLQQVLSANTGLFRFQLRYQRFYFLRWRERAFKVPVQVGKYVVLRQQRIRRLVCHDRLRAVLSVPVACRPPLLIERALVLCSGQLPRLNRVTGHLEYSQVTPDIARMSAALLCQEVHIS